MANRLGNETSPYLLQHKDNPVDWYPWGEEARERARREDRPILLSVGYSACHWCHVMAHESFEDPDTAALMNDLFINIKVDREERPDVDSIYMQAVQSMTGRGGWPMTVFLTPDGWPFYGGTYFPPVDGRGLPAFPRVLQAVADAYREKKTDVARAAGQLREQLDNNGAFAPVDSDVGADVLGGAVAGAAKEFDAVHGGFGHAPKFPPAMLLDFFLRYHHLTGDRGALDMAEFTLDKMARGGMYDQVGGGFHRYSTDAIWLVPHFEKMLYDNALLARVYLDAYRVTGKDAYRRVCQETLDYVLREMTDATGAFYSTQDADSEGVEGKFFLWTMPEFDAVLGADAGLFRHYFGLTPGGNFEGKNILYLEKPLEDFAEERDIPDFRVRLEAARAKLYTARETRVHPGRDEKVLAAWNGLMLRAFAEAGRALDSQAYREAARRNADFLLASMWLPDATAGTKSGKRLLRTWKAGEARLKGYLEDYADLIDGLLATQEATFELHYLEAAITLADEMIDLFWDEEAQGFFDTGRDHEALIARPRDVFDNATPSGSSVAADVLLRLATLTGEARFERYALPVLKTFASVVHRAPTAFGRLLAALHFHLAPVKEVALVWQRDAAPAQSMVDALFLPYRPNIVVAGAVEGEGAEVTPLLADRTALGGCAAYVCEHFVCQLPVTDAEGLEKLLAGT